VEENLASAWLVPWGCSKTEAV